MRKLILENNKLVSMFHIIETLSVYWTPFSCGKVIPRHSLA